MGLEYIGKAIFERTPYEVKVHLDTDKLDVRGGIRLSIPFTEISKANAKKGEVHIVGQQGTLVIPVGEQADKWVDRILNPTPLIDKLGVKPGQKISVVGFDDPDFIESVGSKTDDVRESLRKDSDIIFFRIRSTSDLLRFKTLQKSLKRNGAIWAIWEKGKPQLTQMDIMQASHEQGLVDIKIARFSDALSAIKIVIPRHKR